MLDRDADYYRQRADAEHVMANRAVSREVADLHRELADNYERMAEDAAHAKGVRA